ncbi:MAG: DPP IV N-terminal domain-containing protein, partial [Tenuifilaceae bacterium]|nr:DPP IV N-terminal domain-containing protein [Tenuifilaceae bacterium]
NHIINGAADWVYEEEFALTTGMQWSPDGKKLAFYRFDESRVKQFNMNMFRNQLYPENYAYKYPKAGEDNSIVTIHVYNTATGSTNKMDIGPETNQYIARIKWTTNANELSMIRMNRLQNKLDILVADAATGNSRVLYSEENRYYVDEPADDYLTFTDDGKYFIIPSEKDGYNHLYVYGMDGALVRQLTTGTNEVKTIYGFDAKSKRVYYQAYDGSPMNTAVYFSTIDGKSSGKLTTQEGTNTADFSKGFKYYINFYSSVTVPTLVTLHNSKGKQVRVLEDNARLKETVAGYNMPQREFFTFTTSEGVTLNGYMVKPLNFDANTKYPVMMYQYSGPGSQSVLNRWRIGWDEYLATNGYLVVCVDGRGTGGRGEAFKKMTYGQLGYYESIDQIEAAKYLQTLSYVEPSRIGIWGWSYGGYMSSLCLFKGADVFRMAIAVAPVTNWRYYDSIYTERYMGLPQDNPTGYDNNSPINHVEKLKGKLLIVHGTGDDNVHVQNAVEMIEKLVQANKPFDMMFYPDKNHGIYGGNTTMHLYNLMDSYIKANL